MCYYAPTLTLASSRFGACLLQHRASAQYCSMLVASVWKALLVTSVVPHCLLSGEPLTVRPSNAHTYIQKTKPTLVLFVYMG